MLTEAQIAHFQTFGFLVIRQAFTRSEVEALIREADAAYAEKSDREKDGSSSMWTSESVEERPALMKLMEDDRIYLSIGGLLDRDFIWNGSEIMWGIDPKLADHTWHFDGHKTSRNLDYPRTKVMLYLDPQRKDTGALRVIPGSHRILFTKSCSPFRTPTWAETPTLTASRDRRFPPAPSKRIRATSSSSTSGCITRCTARRENGGSSSSSSDPGHGRTPIWPCCGTAHLPDFRHIRPYATASVPGSGDWPRRAPNSKRRWKNRLEARAARAVTPAAGSWPLRLATSSGGLRRRCRPGAARPWRLWWRRSGRP